MEILNPIYMAPNVTALTKTTKRQKIECSFCLFNCLMKHDGVDGMFSSVKRDISEWGSKYEPKNN